MIEDKLTTAQRIRLECIAQANLALGTTAGRAASPERVIDVATRFEEFINGGGTDEQ